jgi:hypothetical protein
MKRVNLNHDDFNAYVPISNSTEDFLRLTLNFYFFSKPQNLFTIFLSLALLRSQKSQHASKVKDS